MRIDTADQTTVVELHLPLDPQLAFFKLLDKARKMYRRLSTKWKGFVLTFSPDEGCTVEFKCDEDFVGFFSS